MNSKRLAFLFILVCGLIMPGLAAKAETMVIATVDRQPFVMQNNGRLAGFSIDLWQKIAREIGVNSEFKVVPTFREMLDLVNKGKVDAAIANISITAAREQQADFSQPIFDAGLQILVPKPDGATTALFAAIWSSGLLQILGWAFLILIGVAHIMWWIEGGRHSAIPADYVAGVWGAFWWAFTIITMGGFEDNQPSRPLGRALAVVWILASLFATSIFIAKITTALTVNTLRVNISSVQDLFGKKVGVTEGSTAEKFLKRKGLKVIAYQKIDRLFDDVRAGKLDAVVHDSPLLKYYAAHGGKNRVIVVGPIFHPEKYGILFPQGSPWLEKVNRALLTLRENGVYEQIRKKWFGS